MDDVPKPPEVSSSDPPKSKRKMKTASQLQLLEKTYALETYPSEQVRAQLSMQLGLTDRQLQMWFCHRRLKDRKTPAERTVDEVAVKPRQQSAVESAAIAFVETQLREKVREDGPILGMEFDPLPPGAFGMPIIGTTSEGQHKPLAQHFQANMCERSNMNPAKVHSQVIQGASRALQEYQFLPQQPSVKAEMHERAARSYQHGSPADVHSVKTSVLTSAQPLVLADEGASPGYVFQSTVPSLNLLPQTGRQGHVLLTTAGEYETLSLKNSYANIVDAQLSSHPITALEMSSDRRVVHEEDVLRMERKRKSEEARIAREVEAHEKRIRKELEKQDILRRKREEQIRKEMERLHRERQKEEERLFREKQREEERYLREVRREMERREKFLQKESMKAEKIRQKEELRREKEAARQKAASERAIAKKMAKESMELVDDERLELMELAALSKGLPSISSLEFETLQNLHLYRDKLTDFPPKSVLLKRPFAIQPWNLSDENVGNLVMTWRFLITFVDVLGMWPFTLDEFVQALHDYDHRLLGEIHIALLKIIIKDIEDVARTTAAGLGSNQNTSANLGGGHPEIVEGAYAWGFDLCSWHRHLNPLSWPEILRQFALSAGFGPLLKKKNSDEGYIHDENEGNDGEDVVSNLRSGAAVENAVAIMRERGFSNPRRSRNFLTPGTVKYAAFHVLSIEGSRGLTILEVADRIQRSGLRDLSSSKTPEASISAALSRDTKLFERTAPSTYCVRSPYRKDPVDAETILLAARERIRVFKSGFVDGQDAEDAERDDDSGSDATEDPEIDDLNSEVNLEKKDQNSPGANTDNHSLHGNKLTAQTSLRREKERDETIKTPEPGPKNTVEVLSSMNTGGSTDVNGVGPSVSDVPESGNILESAGEDIDESRPWEPWVRGLMEGEYSDLSVEERLSALVSLLGVTLEGNSIRLALEERLEAANALKKQMWTEAQLDKRRVKEDYVMRIHYSSYADAVNKMEPNLGLSAEGRPGRRSPSVSVDGKTSEISVATSQQEKMSYTENNINVQNMVTEASLQTQELLATPDNFINQTPGYAAEMSRSQLKSLVGHKAEEMYVYRSLPLGQDRRRNRYWQFIASASRNDPGSGRIFVEFHNGRWRLIDSIEGFDALLSSLDVRGHRESHLHTMLQKIEIGFKDAIRTKKLRSPRKMEHEDIKEEVVKATGSADYDIADNPSSAVCSADSDTSETSTSFTIEFGKNQSERNRMLNRYQDFEKWMWRECANTSLLRGMKYGKKRCKPLLGTCDNCHDVYFLEDNQCPCQKPYETTESNSYLVCCEDKLKMVSASSLQGPASPLRIRLLKLLLSLIEVSILPEALKPLWSKNFRELWGMKLRSSSTAEEILQLLTLLEEAIERDYLSSDFEITSELLDLSNLSGHSNAEKVAVLPWLPATTAAVALRIMELDASISYVLNQDVSSRKEKGNGQYIKLTSKYAVVKNSQNTETSKTPDRPVLLHEENRADSRTMLSGLSRARADRSKSHSRSGKSRKKASGSRSESGKRSSTSKRESLGQVLVWKGQSRAQVEHKQGRRSARNRQKATKLPTDIAAKVNVSKESIYRQSKSMRKQSEMGLAGQVGNRNTTREAKLQMEMAENASSSERSEYDYRNDLALGDDYNDAAVNNYTIGFNGSKSSGFLRDSDFNADTGIGDDDEVEEDVGDEQEDMDVRGYTGYTIDSELAGDDEEDRNKDPDEEMDDLSSEYSD